MHIFPCILERTDDITNDVQEPVTFVVAYLTVLIFCTYLIQHCKGNDKMSSWKIDSVALFAKD
jgi:hypothetical protein